MTPIVRAALFWTILMIEAGIGLFFILAPTAVTQLYGYQFSEGASIIRILSFGWVFYVAFVPFSFLFLALGDAQTKFWIEFFKLCVGFGFLFWLVPGYGLQGAAWAMTLTLITETAVSFFVLKYRLSTTHEKTCPI